MVILDNYNFILLFNYYIQNTDLISRSVFFYILIELLFVVHCHFLSHFHPNPLIYYPLVLFLLPFLYLLFLFILLFCLVSFFVVYLPSVSAVPVLLSGQNRILIKNSCSLIKPVIQLL